MNRIHALYENKSVLDELLTIYRIEHIGYYNCIYSETYSVNTLMNKCHSTPFNGRLYR